MHDASWLDDSVGLHEVRYISPVGRVFFAMFFWKTWASDPALVADVLAPTRDLLMGLRPEGVRTGRLNGSEEPWKKGPAHT